MANGVRREVLTRWVAPLAAVALVAAVVGLVGGFRPARGDAGPPAEPDETISLTRWEIAVHAVELVDTTVTGSPTSTKLRVHLTLTFTGEESLQSLPTGLIAVVAPDGSDAGSGYQVDQVWGAAVDPDLTRPYALDFTWPQPDADGEQPALTAAPATVTVLLRDETYAEGALFGWSWGADDVAAAVTVPVADLRVGS